MMRKGAGDQEPRLMRLRPAAVVQNGERRYAAVKRRTGGHHRRTYEYKGWLEKNGNNFSSSTVVNNMDYLNNVTKYERALRVAGQDEFRKLNEVHRAHKPRARRELSKEFTQVGRQNRRRNRKISFDVPRLQNKKPKWEDNDIQRQFGNTQQVLS